MCIYVYMFICMYVYIYIFFLFTKCGQNTWPFTHPSPATPTPPLTHTCPQQAQDRPGGPRRGGGGGGREKRAQGKPPPENSSVFQ